MRFQLPRLAYSHTDLQPFLSADQLDTHYFGHHKAYIEEVNRLGRELSLPEDVTLEYIVRNRDGRLFNNAAQAWNHTFYWMGLTPVAREPNPECQLASAISKRFGGMDGLRDSFTRSAASLFGSGWCWLVATPGGELEVVNTQNADNPLRLEHVRPLWTCDVWEHAYYVDYRNERKEYLRSAWRHINWEFVEQCYLTEEVPNMTRLMTRPPEARSPNATERRRT